LTIAWCESASETIGGTIYIPKGSFDRTHGGRALPNSRSMPALQPTKLLQAEEFQVCLYLSNLGQADEARQQ
jgi:hypothetical protein